MNFILLFHTLSHLRTRQILVWSYIAANKTEKCQEGCRALSLDFDRKKLARKMLDVIEQDRLRLALAI